jgi:hypothetical protein
MCCFIVCLAWLEAVVAVQQLKMANHFAKDDAIGDDNNCGVGSGGVFQVFEILTSFYPVLN